ncbi:SDR family NAD(P)-dependent oxidoreductase [Sulfitobacter sp. BDSS02]|nr:SDR family NAD(P)-dependent oxidoreductase [Sulfitobacter sp. BDSS02]MBR9851080.1 SDR family NAD(P)-dependent oxidoreductase [Paracoccaceae bacterium]
MKVLITGGNRGIGQAIANVYRDAGETVIATARDTSGDAKLDVTDPESHRHLAQALTGEPLDLLVCNAGVYLDKGQKLDDGFAPELWADMFAVNVTGVFLTIQSLLPSLRMALAPKIAIISSQMASQERAPGGSYIYRASKAAALNLGRNLAADLRGEGIAVGIYHPGWVRTEMGGGTADIEVDEAARGLKSRFEALSVETTGCFETWDGRAHPF